jgi:hypothetical protein
VHTRTAHTLFKLFSLTMALMALVAGIYLLLMEVSMMMRCSDQVRRIYQALELYEMDRGSLPRLAFYPDEPLTDPDSIRVVLEEYGGDASLWVCPSSHPKIAATGLSYIWNVQLNGGSLRGRATNTWVIVEINALSSDVPAPHLGFHNVLYTDGRVERIRHPLEKLPGL